MTAKQRIRSALPPMILATLLVAINAVFAKQLTGYLQLMDLLSLRFVVPALLMAILCLIVVKGLRQQLRAGLQNRYWRGHVLRAFFVVTQQLCYFYYLYHANIFDATVLINTSPIFMVIFSALFLKARVKPKAWVCVIVSFIGIVLIIKPNDQVFAWAALIGLMAGMLNAGSQLTVHYFAKKVESRVSAWLMYSFSAVLLLLIFAVRGTPVEPIVHLPILAWSFLIALSVFSILNQLLRTKAYAKVNKGASLSAFIYLSIIFTLILQVIVYHQWPGAWSLLGAGLVIVSGVVMVV